MSTSGGDPLQELQVATVHLDAGDIQTLHTVPFELVAAPGAGVAVVVVNVMAEFAAGTDNYLTNNVAVYYGTGPFDATHAAGAAPLTPFDPSAAPTDAVVAVLGSMSYRPTGNIRNVAVNLADDTGDAVVIGPIATASAAGTGAGYAVNDTGTINGGNYATAAPYQVLTVDGLGAVTSWALTGAVNGYDTVTNPHATTKAGAQPGVGVGFTVDIDTIAPADGDLYVSTVYFLHATH